MKVNNVVWVAALIVVALSASLVASRIVTASTDADAAAAPHSSLAQVDFDPAGLPMCQRVSAQGVRIDSVQTWAANGDVVITLDDTCWAGKATTNAVGTFSILLPLVHQKHYTETIGSGTSRTLVPKRTQAVVYVDGVRASFSVPYTVSDVDIYELGRTTSDMVIRAKPDPKLARVAVSSSYADEWVGVFDFKMITLYPEMSATDNDMAQ